MSRFAKWMLLVGLVIVADQLTKFWITQTLRFHETVVVTSFFNWVYVHNPGAAFSFLSDQSGWQRWFFIVLALAVSVWLTLLIRRHQSERWLPLAAALIMGGALGNVIDRIVFGAVIDFVQVHAGPYYWPAFNVADSTISVGVVLLLLEQFRKRPETANHVS